MSQRNHKMVTAKSWRANNKLV